MSFVEPLTIKDAIENIHRKNYLLPAIQREFVWSPEQIERLFDSVMREYPISSFLFWEVERSKISDYQFYEFIRNYHERDQRHNPKANINGDSGIIAILDGQQRFTALYIGLKGTYAYKMPRKHWDNNAAFPERKLCLNLISKSENGDLEYDFRFLTKRERERQDSDKFWFVVSDILDLDETQKVSEYLIKNKFEKSTFAKRALFCLYQNIHKNKIINFFLEKDESLDKVLNIFIRVNSGGTQLNYSDLLLSIATAQWKNKDAREEITSFVDEINVLGDGFNFNKDFVLKSCLILGDFKDIAFKVDNFNQKNMLQIEKEWDDVSRAIKLAVILLSSLGYHRDSLTSSNAVIPIAYYLKKIGSPDNFSDASKYSLDRKKIFKWLVIVLLKRTFSGQSDNILRQIRNVSNNVSEGFPFDEIVERLKGTPKAISFDNDELENLMNYQYGQAHTYSILAFLYPSLNFRNKFHQDHIFPKKMFTRKNLEKKGISQEQLGFFLENYNCLSNLQLLEDLPNQEKAGKDFDQWLHERYPNIIDRKSYMERNYIPDIDLSLINFREFTEERKKLIIKKLKQLLS